MPPLTERHDRPQLFGGRVPGRRWTSPALLAVVFPVLAFPVPAFATGEPAGGRVVEARVARPEPTSPPVEGRVVASLVSGEAEPVVSVLDADGVARLTLPEGTTWRVCVEAEDLWGRCSLVAVEEGGGPRSVQLETWPVGYLAGKLRLAAGEEALPDRVSVTVQTPVRPGRPQEIPETSRRCEKRGEDGFRCPVPAGVLDVTLRAPSFVAHDFWSLSIGAGDERSLGTLELEKGASLAGRVEVVDGEIGAGSCTARLKPFVGQGPGWREAERKAGSEAVAAVHPTGAFRVGGVAPGTYVLIVEQEGFAPARAFPVELARESETRLREPVVLRRPLTLRFELSPASDWLGRPWAVELHRQADFSSGFEDEEPTRRRASDQGIVEIADQAPGTFALRIFDSLGNPMFGDLSVPVRNSSGGSAADRDPRGAGRRTAEHRRRAVGGPALVRRPPRYPAR